MGSHRRTAPVPEPAATPRGRRAARRRGSPVRTGLLASSAALAAGAVGMASGLIPAPGGEPGFGHSLARQDSDAVAGADRSPSAPAVVAPSAPPDRGRAPAGRDDRRAPAPSPSASSPGRPESREPEKAAAPTRTARPAQEAPAPRTPGAQEASGRDDGVAGLRAAVLTLVNKERARAGCGPVAEDGALTRLAQGFSEDMALRNFFDHVDPDGDSPWDRAAEKGITNLGGENIARGQADARAVMEAWMNSPGHRANILNCDYRTLGVGVETGSGGPWWTQNFGF
ncbi:CAP domain-containing protein [Streptomyces sp. SCUT-3]|uniref:CAP domain-containing protein n=2 Tax=unclassified Streptomyces TaxID=2593676 RepID=UPI0015F7DD17|nr:CAP domain-containing protein [Streptomyces sp. SCUT-3]QMV21597.1 CAP domain-containing protein [Streptomyces sp. SCUT-3]